MNKVATILGLPDPYGFKHDEDAEFAEYITLSLRCRTHDAARFALMLESLRSWDASRKALERIDALIEPTK